MHRIQEAASIIKSGGVVAFPTETVYGLGADATNADAVKNIFKIKNRPIINPLIVHVANIEQAESIAILNSDARTLSKFWPGPLTIVVNLKAGHNIATQATAGLSTVAIRIPAHKTARKLIQLAGCPIAAPSANPSGYISATTSTHIQESLASAGIFILENDERIFGLESTIVDTTSAVPAILRYGFITKETIELALGNRIAAPDLVYDSNIIKAPGMLSKHYSPNTKLRLNAVELYADEIGLNFGDSKLRGKYCLSLSKNGDIMEAASNFYGMLRILDCYAQQHNISRIAVAEVPKHGIGLAINDKLIRAASDS